jgi:cell division inhibitor SepF
MGFVDNMKVFFGLEEEGGSEVAPKKEEVTMPTIRSFKAITSTTQSGPSKSASAISEIRVEEPRIYEDSLNIATYLREGKPVIVNLKYLDSESGKRLVDFVCGTAYALSGHMLKIGETIFLFTPNTIAISESLDKTNVGSNLSDMTQSSYKNSGF